MPNNDRFAPESYEDYLSRGKTAQEAARICRELREREEAAEQAERYLYDAPEGL